MFQSPATLPQEPSARYTLLRAQLTALMEGVTAPLSNMANMAALLYQSLPELNWAGFYLCKGETLLLGPFQGKPACVAIPFGKGVCGTAAASRQAQLVPDVHAFPGHIACDGASASELVILPDAGWAGARRAGSGQSGSSPLHAPGSAGAYRPVHPAHGGVHVEGGAVVNVASPSQDRSCHREPQ